MIKLTTVQSIVNGAEKATSKLDKWAGDAAKIADSGGTLNEVQTVLKDIKGLGQLSAVLGAIGAGISIIEFFLHEKSAQEIIIEKLDNLQASVERLGTHLDVQFRLLTEEVLLAAGMEELNQAIDEIDDIKKTVGDLLEARKANQPTWKYEGDLLQWKDPLTAVTTQIRANCVGSASQPNVLEKTYNHDYGNLNQVFAMAHHLLSHAVLAPVYDTMITTIRLKKQGPITEQMIDDLHQQIVQEYHDDLVVITTETAKWISKCWDSMTDNVHRFVTEQLPTQLNSGYEHHQANSEIAVRHLASQWPQFNWSAIVYEPVSGTVEHAFDSHLPTSVSRSLEFFRFPLSDGGTLNLIIYWYPKTDQKGYAKATLDSALNPGADRHDRSLDLNRVGTSPPLRSQHQFVYDMIYYGIGDGSDLKKYVDEYAQETDPAKAPRSLFWILHDYYWERRFGFTCHAPIYGLKGQGGDVNGANYTCLCIYAGPEVLDAPK